MSFTVAIWTALFIASEWVIRIAMIIIVPFRRSAAAARSWLLLVFFLPWPALFLYIFIGRQNHPPWRLERYNRLPEMLEPITQKVERMTRDTQPVLPDVMADTASFVQTLGFLPVVGKSGVDLLPDYRDVIDRLVADIDVASKHVHLLFYIFANDATGRRVIDALKRATARGVVCRVLIDAIGSRRWGAEIERELTDAGIFVRQLLPVGFIRHKSVRADLRNHCKIALIDSITGYVGSQNIIDADSDPGLVNEELMARLTGSIVQELQIVFIASWFLETEEVLSIDDCLPSPTPTGSVACQVLTSGPGYTNRSIEQLLVALVHTARKRIVITTPYFIPSDSLLSAIRIAVLRGAKVHLVVSQPTDHLLVKWAQSSYYAELMEMGVSIHAYRDKFLHAKHVSIDDGIAFIGSSNIDIRSFELNSEIVVVFYDVDTVSKLRKEEERYFASSDLLSLSQWGKRGFLAEGAENLARMVGPLL